MAATHTRGIKVSNLGAEGITFRAGGEIPERDIAVFQTERRRLLGLAYRMLGTIADAEDVLQDTWLTWQAADRSSIEKPSAWLTTVTSRSCLDRLRKLRRRREDYVGPWLPEIVATERDPADEVELADTLTLGFLVLLDRLKPAERLVFLLADVFGLKYAEIATITERTESTCRQVAHRARLALAGEPPSSPPSDANDSLVFQLMAAVVNGDVEATIALLASDVVLVSDGGPQRRAARRPVVTPTRVARLLINVAKRADPDWTVTACVLNGRSGLVFRESDEPVLAAVFEVTSGQIRRIWLVLAPDKLGHLVTASRLA